MNQDPIVEITMVETVSTYEVVCQMLDECANQFDKLAQEISNRYIET